MRSSQAAAAALILLAMAAAIVAGGHVLESPLDEIATPPGDIAPTPASATGQVEDDPSTAAIVPEPPTAEMAPSRAIDPEIVAPPAVDDIELERAAPRPPLSKLSLALPPKPKMPDEWKGTPLFRPVATAAGLVEAKGYTIAVSGVHAVKPDETCTDAAGQVWNCGLGARTAFRAFLHGRAVVCTVPPEGGRDTISAACHIGKQDIGAWLVENGWARAVAGGPYADAAEAARKQRKGIFGAAPDLSGLPPMPPPVDAPEASPSILDLSGEAAMPVPRPAPG